jgi:hypothetical protein
LSGISTSSRFQIPPIFTFNWGKHRAEKAKYVSAGRSARDASNVKDKGAKRKNTSETTSN